MSNILDHKSLQELSGNGGMHTYHEVNTATNYMTAANAGKIPSQSHQKSIAVHGKSAEQARRCSLQLHLQLRDNDVLALMQISWPRALHMCFNDALSSLADTLTSSSLYDLTLIIVCVCGFADQGTWKRLT